MFLRPGHCYISLIFGHQEKMYFLHTALRYFHCTICKCEISGSFQVMSEMQLIPESWCWYTEYTPVLKQRSAYALVYSARGVDGILNGFRN
jgi:hypothetical protein